MSGFSRGNILIGCAAIACALLALLVWIPSDTATGIVETVRRRTVIGDAMAPSLAALFILAGGLLLLTAERHAPHQPLPSRGAVIFALQIAAVLGVSLMLMRWTGPVAAAMAGEEYRLLRDSYPWKLTGYILGGTVMVTALLAMAERRLTLRAGIIALAAVIVLVAVYDLPFDDLLLPPNGDV
jgi:vacuolar-type H+-ATPase subunit I/STV1